MSPRSYSGGGPDEQGELEQSLSNLSTPPLPSKCKTASRGRPEMLLKPGMVLLRSTVVPVSITKSVKPETS